MKLRNDAEHFCGLHIGSRGFLRRARSYSAASRESMWRKPMTSFVGSVPCVLIGVLVLGGCTTQVWTRTSGTAVVPVGSPTTEPRCLDALMTAAIGRLGSFTCKPVGVQP